MDSKAHGTRSRRVGVLLVGHGTRDETGLAEFSQAAELVRHRLPDWPVETAFLELASPKIGEGIDRLAGRDVAGVVVAPLLLFAAGHAKRDIPAEIVSSSQRHAQLRFSTIEPFGCDPKLLELSQQRFQEVWGGLEGSDSRPFLLLVGRGSLDAEATAETRRYAALLAERVGAKQFAAAFLSMAKPSLSTALDELVESTGEPLVVQPHLLFQGDLLRELRERVDQFARQHAGRWVRITPHLGPSPQLAEVLVERILAVA